MLISKNSYLVLGLHTDSDEKSLNKRYKELLNFLYIDEVGGYENDFLFLDYKQIRTEENIKVAFQNLSNQHKRLYQTFFWFHIVDKSDEECINNFISGNYTEGLNKWLELFENTNKYHYLKNYVIGQIFLYENKKQLKNNLTSKDSSVTIVNSLYNLIKSEIFWKEFKEIFNVQNDIAVRDDMIEIFRNEIIQSIAEHFFDISEQLLDSKLYKEFSEKFGISAKELDDNKNVIQLIRNIEDTIKSIIDMNLASDLDIVITGVYTITGEVEKLDKLGLENNPKIIKLKDDVSREIRSIAIKLFNDYDDTDNTFNLIEQAQKISHSNSLKEKLKQDLKDMDEQLSKTDMFKSIINLSKEGKKYYENKNYKSAKKIYDGVIKLILEDFSEIFNLEKKELNLLISKIESSFDMIPLGTTTTESVFDNIDKMKKMINEDGGFSWGENLSFLGLGEEQKLLLILLIDSVVYGKMSHMISNKSSYQTNGNSESNFSGWIIWIIIAIIIAIARSS